MRDVIVRGKTENNDWIQGCLIKRYNGYFGIDHYVDGYGYIQQKVYPDSIGQFTHLTDNNNKSIFEGDIVMGVSEYFGSLSPVGVIVWYAAAFYISFFDRAGGDYKEMNDTELLALWNKDIVVIGNTFDNPELLERKLKGDF